jgi:hypothetical protein
MEKRELLYDDGVAARELIVVTLCAQGHRDSRGPGLARAALGLCGAPRL